MSSTAFRLLESYAELEQLRAEGWPILLSAFAKHCPVCLQQAAEERITAEFTGQILLLKMNVDDVPQLVDELAVELIPTLLLFVGEDVNRFTAIPSREGRNVIQWLRKEMPPATSVGPV